MQHELEILQAAERGFTAQLKDTQEKLDYTRKLLAEASGAIQTDGSTFVIGTSTVTPHKKAKRKLSPEAREAIRQGQIKRWAAAKIEKEPEPDPVPKKRVVSPEGLEAIRKAAKKRWARVKRLANKPT